MLIETYEVLSLDVDAEGHVINEVVSEEALALIETLGLEGQQALVQRTATADGETVETRIPYRQTTAEEKAIFATLFPIKTPIHKYKGDAIPLRALQVAAHARTYDLELYVLHPATNIRQDDPVLVGEAKVAPSASNGYQGREMYLLARWGEALDDLDTLRAKALPKAIAKLTAEAKLAASKFEAVARNAEEIATQFLHGEAVERLPQFVSVSLPSFQAGH
jgi:hypothetical protein